MCGLVGFVCLEGINQYDPQFILKRMNRAISHRGPDGEGYYLDERCAMAHRRLSIIDLEGGAQPWRTEDARYSLVFNGEIYNHHELRRQLEKLGYRYQSHCDTETVMNAYRAWGDTCVEKFVGMFAFVIWDKHAGRVFAARDRLGI